MQERNDPENGLANGDQGIVKHVTFGEDKMKRLVFNVIVDFPQASEKAKRKPVRYVASSKWDLETHLKQAWGISVHKAQ
ncbi:hypothetical protein DUNSADRAFT_11859, partial [Dunaliella salina]